MLKHFFLTTSIVFTICACVKPGPETKATRGEVWPKPLWQEDTGEYFKIDPADFVFVVMNQNCDLLQRAICRYTKIVEETSKSPLLVDVTPTLKTITQIEVNLTNPCETLPYFGMDESYYVYGAGKVVAKSIWGILRGLETFSQLLVPMSDGMLRIVQTNIYDQPRFTYRGLMLDTARHFISVQKIMQLIDAMSYNKFNVFHWHMTDDSSFPYNSTRFPELAKEGAYDHRMTYSVTDIAQVVEYATLLGIRVIPEFDTPSHTASWGISHPEMMTLCYGSDEVRLGPFNPIIKFTFVFLRDFFNEIKNIFPDSFIHLGGDEIDTACWESNPDIQQYLEDHNQDFDDLPYMFFETLTSNITKLGRTPMLWQEAVVNNPCIDLPKGTIVQVWSDSQNVMAYLTKNGYTTILSEGFYLYTADNGSDWIKFYNVEPTDFIGSKSQKNHVAGGEACLWTEWVNDHNVISVAFPRASAVAERLWSDKVYRDVDEAKSRLEEHNCRMSWRGIETKPANGYGFC